MLGKVLLGTIEKPVVLCADNASLAETTVTAGVPKALAVDYVNGLEVALSEQIGGDGGATEVITGASLFDQQRSTDSFLYYPALLNYYCRISDKAIAATARGSENSLFGDVMWLKSSHLGNWDRAIKTNLLPVYKKSINANPSVKIVPIIFGQNRAVMATPPYTDSTRTIKDQKNLVDVDRDVRYYDFFPAFPNFLGVGYVTFDAY